MPAKYISPWPKADAQRRAAMNRPVHPIKSTPAQPRQQKYYVLGVEVDRETYWKYEKQMYQLADDHFTSLIMVRAYAEGKELSAEFPKEAEAARKIIAQIRAELTGKDITTMKTPRTAADFIGALADIYTESRATYDALQKKVDTAKANMDRAEAEMRDPACKNRQMAEARYSVAKGEYQIAKDACRGEYRQMITSHETKVKELRAQFAAHLDDFYSASPDALDAATMQLLDSGVCKASDIARLAERHQASPTMLRIIGSYARKMREDKHISSDDSAICAAIMQKANAAKDGSRELAIFDSAAGAALYGLDKEPVHASRMHTHIEGWFDDFRDKMVNLPNSPVNVSEEPADQ